MVELLLMQHNEKQYQPVHKLPSFHQICSNAVAVQFLHHPYLFLAVLVSSLIYTVQLFLRYVLLPECAMVLS